MVGPSGSGKTTLALERYSNLMRLETDMYFSREGEYRFTLDLNKKAVEWFIDETAHVANTGMDFVLTGVFAAHTERLDKVIQIGIDHGYDVYVHTLIDSHGSVHGVPEEHLNAMRESFVNEEQLKESYADKAMVHFGLMDNEYPLAHVKQQH